MVDETGRSVIFAYIDEPPFVAPAETPWPTGCDAEVAALVLDALGIDAPEARLTTFAELLPGVAAGRWTLATALFVTEQRSRLVRFSRPIWALPDGLMTRCDDLSRLGAYEAIAAHATARIGGVRGQVQMQTARTAGVPRARVIGYPTPDAVVAALLNGEVDAYASVATAHRGFLARHPDPRLAISDLGDPQHAVGPAPIQHSEPSRSPTRTTRSRWCSMRRLDPSSAAPRMPRSWPATASPCATASHGADRGGAGSADRGADAFPQVRIGGALHHVHAADGNALALH
jgi:polar amino acid transport system substrate-binding protein